MPNDESQAPQPNVAPTWRRYLPLLAVAVFMLFVYLRPLPTPDFPSLTDSIREQADMNWTVQALDGSEISIESFKGRVLFLTFWATWCGPCRWEMPSLQELHDTLGDAVTFAHVSNESMETLTTFITENEVRLPIYRLPGQRPTGFESNGVPVTFIIDAQGLIRFRHQGTANWASEEAAAFLRALASESPPERQSRQPKHQRTSAAITSANPATHLPKVAGTRPN